MELDKIEISQEDYDFIKAFISEYAFDEEGKEMVYEILDFLKDQEEEEEDRRIFAASLIYAVFIVTVGKIGDNCPTLLPDAEEPPIRISPTCDEL